MHGSRSEEGPGEREVAQVGGERGDEEGNPRPARRHHLDTAILDNLMATEASLRPSSRACVCLAMACYGRWTMEAESSSPCTQQAQP
jgi:hypothetical protein